MIEFDEMKEIFGPIQTKFNFLVKN